MSALTSTDDTDFRRLKKARVRKSAGICKSDDRIYFATMATKSRTVFSSEIENALPSLRLNQNALDEPPSRLRARSILKSLANCVVKIWDKSVSVTSEQNPSAARPSFAVAANVRR